MALIASLPVELEALKSSLRGDRRSASTIPGVHSAHLEGREIVWLTTGTGARGAEEKVSGLLRSVPVERVLSVGFGGGLTKTLRSGDILLAREVTELETPGEVRESDAAMHELARTLPSPPCGVHTGRLVTAARVIRRSVEKLELGKTEDAQVVDMESSGVARALDRAGVPALYARCVIDEADLELRFDPAELLDPEGRPRLLKVLRLLLSRPSNVRQLRAMARRSHLAARNLAWLVRGLVSRLPAEGSPETHAEG